MSRRAPGLKARTWLGAAAGSVAIHVLGVLALIRGQAGEPRHGWWAVTQPAQVDWIDIVSLDDPAAKLEPELEPPSARDRHDAPEADETRDRAAATAPRIADGRVPESPAADSGDRAGRTTDGAWRRDRSTLHERLTDGATVFQSPRSATAASSASPEAVRSEPVVGTGDAIRTQTPASATSAPQRAALDESLEADAASSSARGVPAAERVVANAELPRRADQPSEVRGIGPIDAEHGARSFDTQVPGAAGDDRDVRAASNERHMGVIELSRAGVRATEDAEALSGRGPGDAPGAVDRPTAGRAPAEYGGARAQQVGDQAAESTRVRHRDLYVRQITQRVNSLREFPKRLALRLEQGETIVRFVVDTDGRIRSGVRVTKSSGFDEFDREAARAVERAAPFPPLPDALPVSMRVRFENPLVQ